MGGGSTNLFDMETEFKAEWFRGIINAVTNAYALQEDHIQKFIGDLNIAAAMILMEPHKIKKRDRLELRNCVKDIMYAKRQLRIADLNNTYESVLARLEPLIEGAVSFILEAIMMFGPTVREHFLRSLNIPSDEPESNEQETEEAFH